ncbi:hypothetical protein [Thalassobacillus hwangdonensis]|uniref:Uncharacterized protein n=1 Tax=Thalassobacillus hwangdonensis TaxID=546108 RepID=A0ABW3L2T9_9BACI
MGFLVLAILIIYLFDFTKFRQQNKTLIEQNERLIELVEEISSQNHRPEEKKF